jgi:hypothetical protein
MRIGRKRLFFCEAAEMAKAAKAAKAANCFLSAFFAPKCSLLRGRT